MENWDEQIAEAKRIAEEDMGVQFTEVDVEAFKEKVLPLHEQMLEENPKIRDFYEHIQKVNKEAGQEKEADES